MLTLNEKLETISELEEAGFNEETVAVIVESIENSSNMNRYNSVEELWGDIDTHEEN